jgi:RecJ-like exonuclease
MSEATKLCEVCRGEGTDDRECRPRFAGDVDSRDVPYAVPTPKCRACDGKGRVPLGAQLRR